MTKEHIETQLSKLIFQKNYPCVAAIQAMAKRDFQIGVYRDFGSGIDCERLAADLIRFRNHYQQTKSTNLSFFAVFEGVTEFTEEEFETRLWKELSYLTSLEKYDPTWDPHFSKNPEDKNFCFSLDGTAFFVVGLHPGSSRQARQFPQPTLVFNVYEQFRDLQKAGKYEAMIQTNRKRDMAYQGSANPMAEIHGDDWEAIQFSGRNNSSEWKCPFHHGLKPTP